MLKYIIAINNKAVISKEVAVFFMQKRRSDMLKSCNRCGGIHDINATCNKGRNFKKKDSQASRFRDEYSWKQKRKQIKERDKYLCKVCRADIFHTTYLYNYSKIEVHHIISLEQDYSKRLEDDNLITLCSYHHHLAEIGKIPVNILQMLTAEEVDFKKVKIEAEKLLPPAKNGKK